MIGTTIGSYRVTGLLGEGGMGRVYLAQHVLLGRPAAVKVLLPALSQAQEVVTRFFNEARAATAVRHPGIVEVYDFGFHTDGSAFLAMELLDGESLAARLHRGPCAPPVALTVARQIAGVLAAAHGAGIVHRDLKPDNIFMVPDPELPTGERVKLLDFGIAKLVHDGGRRTRPGALMGTPTYMAPEQCLGLDVDARADLYALGCILFEMLAGRTPFTGDAIGELLRAHVQETAPSIASLVPGLSLPTVALIRRLLERSPAARPQRAADVIAAIDAQGELARVPGALTWSPARTAGPPTTLSGAASAALPRAGRSRGFGLRLAAAVLATAAAVSLIVIGQRSAPPSTIAAPADGARAHTAADASERPVSPAPPAPPAPTITAPPTVASTPTAVAPAAARAPAARPIDDGRRSPSTSSRKPAPPHRLRHGASPDDTATPSTVGSTNPFLR